MFLVNSRQGLFTATTLRWHPFSRSYGANLPSSLTWFLSRTLGFSPRLPVSVYGTDTLSSTFRSFSSQQSISEFVLGSTPIQISGISETDLPISHPTSLARHFQSPGSLSILRPSITQIRWYRNINLLSIDYAFRPRLRFRLTLRGRTFRRNPRAFGDQDSHLVFRYSCLHGHLYTVHLRFHIGFNPYTTLLYQYNKYTPRLRFQTSVPIIFGAESLDQ